MNLSKTGRFKSGALVGVLLLVLIPCGCRLSMPELKVKSKLSKDLKVTYNQARLLARSLVNPVCGEIEQAADHIIATTTNAAVRRAALLWKIEGVPAMRAALYQPDPVVAMADAWALCFQMRDYFQAGPGKEAMGAASAIAVASCQRMEEEINRVSASMTVSGNLDKERDVAG